MDDRSRRLYDLGEADLSARFDPALNLVRNPFLPHLHQPHPSLWYAGYLLRAGEAETAARIVEAALALQHLDEGDPHYGNFRWHLEDAGVHDLNACQFVLEALLAMPLALLPEPLHERTSTAMRLAYAEAERLDVHWTYTNIYLLDVHNRILGGQLLGDERLADAGLERLRSWAQYTRDVGAPHEFNSPTYAAVDLTCLADVAERAANAEARAVALEMEQLIWRHIAQYWHAPTMQPGGPHSRAYRRDVVGAPGFLKVVLYKLLGDERLLAPSPYYEGPDAEGHIIVARTTYHCPRDAEAMFREPGIRSVHEAVALSPRTEATALITPALALGTLSRPYGVGEPRERWPMDTSCSAYWRKDAAPGYGVLYCRYRVNAGRTGERSREGKPKWLDIWEDGVFRTAQNGGRAVAAYGLTPRGQRPVESLRLDIRLLGVDGTPAYQGGAVVIESGDVFIGIVPLEPTPMGAGSGVTVWRDGDELVVSIANYEGPAKVFWEYRTLSGPFWKGNVRNGFALWIAPRTDFPGPEAFRRSLVDTPLTDKLDGTRRRVVFGSGTERVELVYDLREMWP